ncbi:hypothetical protein ACA910_002650 [Epithemia clementina (nom. ined.)]
MPDHTPPSTTTEQQQQQQPPPPGRPYRRREILKNAALVSSSLLVLGVPSLAGAGEIGARITQAVTQSDLGVSVRRSVVRGAQIMDSMDGQWERFSDRFGLGTARQQQPGKPAPKVIPDPKPLDVSFAQSLLAIADESFCQTIIAAAGGQTAINSSDLEKQVRLIQDTVGPSFLRSGLSADELAGKATMGAATFNFLCYCHFKAYSDTIIQRRIEFKPFLANFELMVGKKVAGLVFGATTSSFPSIIMIDSDASRKKNMNNSAKLARQFEQARGFVDDLARTLEDKGLVAQFEVSPIEWNDDQQVADWLEGLSDLEWSLSLDGDITLGSQLLLQEQGYRLYPNFARFVVKHLLTNTLPTQRVDITDYYLDTDYNSDPAKFAVKEILLNIVLDDAV